MRVGILVSHPIQYYSPWFRALAKQIDLQVLYAHKGSPQEQAKAGFDVAFEWDVDLLSGYPHRFLHNVSPRPDPDVYGGCDTPEITGIIKDEGFDAFVVSGWYLKSYWQAVRACRRNRVPVLVRGDSQLRMECSRLKRWSKRCLYRVAFRQFDGFLTVGKRNREYLLYYGVPEERLFSAPHFVDKRLVWIARGYGTRASIRNPRPMGR
jgi:hypothetical protein